MADNVQIENRVKRLILKDEDVLLVYVPDQMFRHKEAIKSIYSQIKKQLLPRKNKVLMLPNSIEIAVIGKEQIEEYISQVDIWKLFEEDDEENAEV